jgi:dTDP-4-amino-4,6-dideoxygalactose transaminase
MVVLNDKNQARLCRLYRNQGMAEAYMNEIVGFNLRMTDIHAALGSSQLKKLMKWTEKRQANAQFLTSRIEGVETPLIPEGFQHVFHQYTIRVNNNRDWFSKRLTEEGVGSRVFYPTEVHRLPSFNQNSHLRNSNVAIGQVLSLPVHPSLTGKDLAKIVRAVNKIAKENKFYA